MATPSERLYILRTTASGTGGPLVSGTYSAYDESATGRVEVTALGGRKALRKDEILDDENRGGENGPGVLVL